MPSTTIHFPEEILFRIDTSAQRKGISRNKFFLKACEDALEKEDGEWPEDFFTPNLDDADILLLKESSKELEKGIYSHRHNRGVSLL